jgi:HSP20 family protein
MYDDWKRKFKESVPSEWLNAVRGEFEDVMQKFFGEQMKAWTQPGATPAVDMVETGTDVLVKAEVPGIDPNDIEVSIVGRVLSIKGRKKEDLTETEESSHQRERQFGEFSRSITLPCEVQDEKATAKCRNGLLLLKLPKLEPEQKKTIPIHSE